MEYLAGPALRHTNTSEINIWFIIDSLVNDFKAEVTDSSGAVLNIIADSSLSPVSVGEKAYVYLIKLIPIDEAFPVDILLNYDIWLDGNNLLDFGLTSGDNRITYDNESLPGFMLKSSHQTILQGSCRKAHADRGSITQHDMLLSADELIKNNIADSNNRPTLLFLTGDQIYADDVAEPVMANIKQQAQAYINRVEFLPVGNGAPSNVLEYPLSSRKEKLEDPSLAFTSSHLENHLLSFSEYFMMHCIVWGGIGHKCPDADDVVFDIDPDDYDEDEYYQEDLEELKDNYSQNAVKINQFLSDAKRVRRLMANVPTYMIFDDHEVTDDWNLHEDNYNKLRTNALSRRVQANALASYWLCQGWGNTPDAFDRDGFIKPIENYLTAYDSSLYGEFEKPLFEQYWGYTIDSVPPVVVLDTRTRRSFNENNLARLVDVDSLTNVADELKVMSGSSEYNECVLLVSPSPVYGFTQIERKQLAMSETFSEALDVECWIADESGFKQLQSIIRESGFKNCAIFSGDVHYGFCRHEKLISSRGEEINAFQLTSSSLHNSPGTLAKIGLDILAFREAFSRSYSSYLLPTNSDEGFLNQSSNIGVLRLLDGKPMSFELNSEVPDYMKERKKRNTMDGFTWKYDLNKVIKLDL